ncbi:MAG: Asp-tRNA(Asn)/Glu-tRNA(Gln) amidotransferase subunit GatC [Clostridia bacterium]|nr:Asp-tRNA(Asn)/Glu-tRNA(Gln) amidotransferase subunit GatC [Clostridia bacterium]
MDFDIKQAKNLAKLSRLEFSDDELKAFLKDFKATLQQVSLIERVDASNVDVKKEDDIVNILELRTDKVVNTFSQEQVVQNAPDKKDGAFLVPLTVD